MSDPAAAPQETGALIDHILANYHDAHREELAFLVTLARKIEAVHGEHPQAPLGLGDVLERLFHDMEAEMQREEDEIFPLMRGGGRLPPGSLDTMRNDHDRHAGTFAEAIALTGDLNLPADACRSWTTLYAALGSFGSDLRAHLQLEDEILIPRFAA